MVGRHGHTLRLELCTILLGGSLPCLMVIGQDPSNARVLDPLLSLRRTLFWCLALRVLALAHVHM
jgi:hypothetical protein